MNDLSPAMFKRIPPLWASILPLVFLTASSFAQNAAKLDEEDLTLENLFPQKSLFGPSARSPEFSHDGNFAAYLYRPYEERRHGNDLWIYDFKKSKATRLTNIEMMSKFQRSARIVIEDRIAKHRKSNQKDGKPKSSEDKDDSRETKQNDDSAQEEQVDSSVYLQVSDGDADEDYSPAYSGISLL